MVDAKRQAGSLADRAGAALPLEHRLVVRPGNPIDLPENHPALRQPVPHAVFLAMVGVGLPFASRILADLLLVSFTIAARGRLDLLLVTFAIAAPGLPHLLLVAFTIAARMLADLLPVTFTIAACAFPDLLLVTFAVAARGRTPLFQPLQLFFVLSGRPVAERKHSTAILDMRAAGTGRPHRQDAKTCRVAAPGRRRAKTQTHLVILRGGEPRNDVRELARTTNSCPARGSTRGRMKETHFWLVPES